ncbi:MAG: SoxR reducing system RseC family protein [Calditrichaeota bacterium]|nr:SoxR reducing system RseC family protein [Calditrichota bacterium]
MEIEIGKIVKLKNEKAVVQMEAGSQCNHCSAKHSCAAMGGVVRQIEIPVKNGIHVGDNVTLSYQAKSRIISAFLVFILPIIFLMAGYFMGFELFSSEGKAILSGITALIFSFVVLWGLNKILAKRQLFLPTILKAK